MTHRPGTDADLPLPARYLLTQRAATHVLPRILYSLPEEAEVRDATRAIALERPAVLLLTPEDILGPGADELAAVLQLCRPGRPIMIGGTTNRDALMAAINRWRVAHVVPLTADTDALVDVLLDAHRALLIDLSVPRATAELAHETDRLDRLVADLRETRGHLLHAERLSTMGRITGGLIVALKQHIERLAPFEAVIALHELHDPEVAPLVRAAFDGIHGISALIDEVNAYAEGRGHTVRLEPVSIDRLVERVVAFARFDRLGRERAIELETSSGVTVNADPHRLSQALLNLLRNAFQATEPYATIRVVTEMVGHEVSISVTDKGPGIPPEVVRRIFEPFYTTKSEGMGLGLHVTRMSIEHQNGRIDCRSTPGQGATFVITFPVPGR